MIRIERTEGPQSLRNNYKRWGRHYKKYRDRKPTSTYFNWRCYAEIEEALFTWTDNHCSYCDIVRLRQYGPTIDHFKPKKVFPRLAYVWTNLFYSCGNCQKKGKKFDPNCKPLKPDQASYYFDHFFILTETAVGLMIDPNPKCSADEQKRAKITIEYFSLNKFARPEARLAELRKL